MTDWSGIKEGFRGISVGTPSRLSLQFSGREGAGHAQKPGKQGVFAREEVGLRRFYPKHGLAAPPAGHRTGRATAHSTATSGRISSSRFGPIPLTRSRKSEGGTKSCTFRVNVYVM